MKFYKNNIVNIFYTSALPLSIADAASKGASGIIALLIARYLGPALYGQYATASSVCGMFMLITGIGFEQEFIRRGGIKRENVSHSLTLNFISLLITSVFAYLALLTFLLAGIYSEDIAIFSLLLGVVLIINRFHLPFRYLYLLLDKSYVTAVIQSIATFGILLFTGGVLYYKPSLILIIFSQLLVGFAILLLWLFYVPRQYIDKNNVNKYSVIQFFKNSIPFALSNIIWIAYFNFDAFMLSLFRPASEVGIYAGVYRIIGINYIFGYAVSNAFTPTLYRNFSETIFKFNEISRQLFTSVLLVGLLMSSCLFSFSEMLIPGIIGDGYTSGILISKVLSIAVFFRLLNFGLCEILTTSHNQKARVYMEASMLLTNILLNFFMIPKYGGFGAAFSTVGAELILFFGSFAVCLKKNLLGSVDISFL